MVLNDEGVRDSYRKAVDKANHVRTLARLNKCSDEEIIEILGELYEAPEETAETFVDPVPPRKNPPPPPPDPSSEKAKRIYRNWKAIRDEIIEGATVDEIALKYNTTAHYVKKKLNELLKKETKDITLEEMWGEETVSENQETVDESQKTVIEEPQAESIEPDNEDVALDTIGQSTPIQDTLKYTPRDDLRTYRIIDLIRDDDSDEIKEIAADLILAINRQIISKELGVDFFPSMSITSKYEAGGFK